MSRQGERWGNRPAPGCGYLASRDGTVRIWDAMAGTESTRIALDAAVSALAVHNGNIALGDALGRVHVFEAEEFLRQKGNAL